MSLRYMLAVLDPEQLPPLTSSQAFVLLCLADHANDSNGICWPSVSTIARRCRLEDRATRYALKELEQLGLLMVERKPGTSSVYRLTFRNDTPAQNAGPPRHQMPDPAPPRHQMPDTPAPNAGPPRHLMHPNLLSEPPIENTKTRARAREAVITAPEEKPRRPLPKPGSLDEVLLAALKAGTARDYIAIRYGVTVAKLERLLPEGASA